MDFRFSVHDDIESIKNIVPIAYFLRVDRYIMQEDRIVHIGDVESCIAFMKANENKSMETAHIIALNRSAK